MSSSLSQSVLMALTVTVNKFASSNVNAVRRSEAKKSTTKPPRCSNFGRREALLSAALAAYPVADSRTELLKKYLKKSEENKAKNDKERTDSYYKRNYKDYFEYEEGPLRAKKEEELTEAEKGILDWLKKNK